MLVSVSGYYELHWFQVFDNYPWKTLALEGEKWGWKGLRCEKCCSCSRSKWWNHAFDFHFYVSKAFRPFATMLQNSLRRYSVHHLLTPSALNWDAVYPSDYLDIQSLLLFSVSNLMSCNRHLVVQYWQNFSYCHHLVPQNFHCSISSIFMHLQLYIPWA